MSTPPTQEMLDRQLIVELVDALNELLTESVVGHVPYDDPRMEFEWKCAVQTTERVLYKAHRRLQHGHHAPAIQPQHPGT